MAALGGAAGSGMLVSGAAAQVARREEEDSPPPLLIAQSNAKAPVLLAGHRSHRSHSSHRSHRSHYSGRGGGYSSGSYRGGSTSTYVPERVRPDPPPPPPKPARITLIAYPGGKIFVDGKPVGRDATGTLVLKPGSYEIRVENRFVGDHTQTITLGDGQTGTVTISW